MDTLIISRNPSCSKSGRGGVPQWIRVALSIVYLFPVLFLIVLAGCMDSKDRPPGFAKLGPVTEFMKPVVYSAKHALLIRKDERGLYAMSMLSTKDLTPLKVKKVNGKTIIYSPTDGSEWDEYGNLLKGPAKKDLPYYSLFVDRNRINGPKDTLYCRIGDVVSRDWRLRIHFYDPEKGPPPDAKKRS